MSYGSREACSMCISIAISTDSAVTARKAMQAALSFSTRPLMHQIADNENGSIVSFQTNERCTPDYPHTYEGYRFRPSSLHDGLVVLISRLLRPIWCKAPFTVHTDTIAMNKYSTGDMNSNTALVEILLDDATSDDIQKPLIRLQDLMRELFPPAISVIPGALSPDSDSMEISDMIREDSLLTRAVQYQTQASTNNLAPSDKELRVVAHLSEERSLHSLYRIVSRSSQLLSLLSHLRRAHVTPELPEVDFGLLHGEWNSLLK